MEYVETIIQFVVSFIVITAFGTIFQSIIEGASGFPLIWVIELVLPGPADSLFGILKDIAWAGIGVLKFSSFS